VLGTFGERFPLVFRKADAAEENRVAALAELARLQRQSGSTLHESRPAGERFGVLEIGSYATQNVDGSTRYLGADTVPG